MLWFKPYLEGEAVSVSRLLLGTSGVVGASFFVYL